MNLYHFAASAPEYCSCRLDFEPADLSVHEGKKLTLRRYGDGLQMPELDKRMEDVSRPMFDDRHLDSERQTFIALADVAAGEEVCYINSAEEINREKEEEALYAVFGRLNKGEGSYRPKSRPTHNPPNPFISQREEAITTAAVFDMDGPVVCEEPIYDDVPVEISDSETEGNGQKESQKDLAKILNESINRIPGKVPEEPVLTDELPLPPEDLLKDEEEEEYATYENVPVLPQAEPGSAPGTQLPKIMSKPPLKAPKPQNLVASKGKAVFVLPKSPTLHISSNPSFERQGPSPESALPKAQQKPTAPVSPAVRKDMSSSVQSEAVPQTTDILNSPDIAEKISNSPSCITKMSDIPSDIAECSVEQIGQCLSLLSLEKYVDTFRNEMVDGKMLVDIEDHMFEKEFGMSRFHALKLRKFIQGYRPKVA